VNSYLHTYLLRLRKGQAVHRTANLTKVWDEAVAIAKLMPRLEVDGNRIRVKEDVEQFKLVVSSSESQIVLPAPGRYTLRELWLHQPEPRSEFFSFASTFGLYAKRNPSLVKKKKSNGYVKWLILENAG
jgi:hypothetical protein